LEAPCLRCKTLGKDCGEKSRRAEASTENRPTEDTPLPVLNKSGTAIKPPSQTSILIRSRNFKPDFKIPASHEIDTLAIMNDAVRILESHYCAMDKDKITSVVRNVLLSFGLDSEQREGSPAPTLSTAPRGPSRSITPEPTRVLHDRLTHTFDFSHSTEDVKRQVCKLVEFS
jgi:hypothetical protein